MLSGDWSSDVCSSDLPLQPLLDDLHMQKSQETAAEAEAQGGGGLRFEGEGRVVAGGSPISPRRAGGSGWLVASMFVNLARAADSRADTTSELHAAKRAAAGEGAGGAEVTPDP